MGPQAMEDPPTRCPVHLLTSAPNAKSAQPDPWVQLTASAARQRRNHEADLNGIRLFRRVNVYSAPNLLLPFGTVKAMTAIIRTLTPQGFVVAADGRQTNADTGAVESDEVQKVFPITSTIGIFAISFCGAEGLTSIDTGEEISLPQLAMHCAKSLESRKTSNALGYAHRISRCMNETVQALGLGGPIHSGKSAQPNMPDETGDTICRFGLDGYESNGRPVAIDMRFYHVGGELQEPQVTLNNPLYVGFHRAYIPCPIIANILWMSDGDQRLAAYRGPIKYANEITLQDAVDRSKALILAHSDPEAIAIDDNSRVVGGHIHIAAIAFTEGFKWLIPPAGLSVATPQDSKHDL